MIGRKPPVAAVEKDLGQFEVRARRPLAPRLTLQHLQQLAGGRVRGAEAASQGGSLHQGAAAVRERGKQVARMPLAQRQQLRARRLELRGAGSGPSVGENGLDLAGDRWRLTGERLSPGEKQEQGRHQEKRSGPKRHCERQE